MRAAARSVSARSVSVRRAGSALTIGVGAADAYTRAANILRPSTGRMFIASPQYAAQNTDGSGAIANGAAVGLWRDYVGGTATLAQATAGKKLVAANSSSLWSFRSDGLDDVLIGTPGPTLSDGLVMVWAGAYLTAPGAAFKRLLAADDTNTGANAIGLSATLSTVTVAALVSGANAASPVAVSVALGEVSIVTAVLTSTGLRIRKNGGQWVSSSHSTPLPNTVMTPGIGARPLALAGFSNSNHSFSCIANMGANATDANIRILEEAAAKAAGVTL